MKRPAQPRRRTGLIRRVEPRGRWQNLSPMSRRERAKQTERTIVIALVKRRDQVCQFSNRMTALAGLGLGLDVGVPTDCAGPLDVHEVIPRSAWRDGELVESNCVLVCRRHHHWIDDHPSLAHEMGLHGYSWERP